MGIEYKKLPNLKGLRSKLKNGVVNIEREDEGLIVSTGVRRPLIPLFAGSPGSAR